MLFSNVTQSGGGFWPLQLLASIVWTDRGTELKAKEACLDRKPNLVQQNLLSMPLKAKKGKIWPVASLKTGM